MKTCNKCNKTKDLNEFTKKKTNKDGLFHSCRSCKNKYDKAYHTLHKARKHESVAKYRQRLKEEKKPITTQPGLFKQGSDLNWKDAYYPNNPFLKLLEKEVQDINNPWLKILKRNSKKMI